MATDWIPTAGIPMIREREVHVWKGHVTALAPFHATLLATFGGADAARAERFRSEDGRMRHVMAHGILRLLLASYCDCALGTLAFGIESNGRPHLIAPASGLSFNLSHSGDVVLVAIANGSRVGVDVEEEKVRDAEELMRVARRSFSAVEQSAMESLAPDHLAHFYATWARKEAYLKGTGAGMSGGTRHFDVCHLDVRPLACIRDDSSAERWWLFDLPQIPGYAVALAADDEVASVAAFEVSGDLLRDVLRLP